jgi:RecA/RadA recombinase
MPPRTRKRKSAQKASEIEEAAEKPVEKEVQGRPKRRDLLSTGSTLMNLACSDNPFGGFLKGKYYLLVGDSSSGKTFLSMTCFAESTLNKHFKDYRLIHDNVEDGMLMDVQRLFGKSASERLEPPKWEDGEAAHSYTIEDFYHNVDNAILDGRPFIYVLDSMDGLSSDSELTKFQEGKDAAEKGKEAKGSYGDGKAKKNSAGLRPLLAKLKKTGSILIVICQTRDNLGFGFEKKTRSGGNALKFYATLEIWTSVMAKIKRTVKGKERVVGRRVKVVTKKNRITGRDREIELEIYPSYGIDDMNGCIDYLLDEKWWSKSKASIVAEELGVTMSRPKLLQHIEENDLENEVRAVVGKCWKEVDEATALKRKARY